MNADNQRALTPGTAGGGEISAEELGRGYVCPADASPAWREACEFGFDMSLVEEMLRLTPEERLDAHQRMLDMIADVGGQYGAE